MSNITTMTNNNSSNEKNSMSSSLKRILIPSSLLLLAYLFVSPFVFIQNEEKSALRVESISSLESSSSLSSSSSASSSLESKRRSLLDQTYKPTHPAKYFNNEKPKEEDRPFDTGSFGTCTTDMKTSTKPEDSKPIPSHPEAGMAIISCREVHYRAPLREIEKGNIPIVVGVLSGAGGKGPIHRDSIRSTWARGYKGVYFIVAGPWEDIEKEYNHYRDLIWIDEEEVYEGEESVLPFKTEIFIYIMNKYTLPGKAGFEYLFKTDDDSYVDLAKLENEIIGKEGEPIHYWGCCTDINYKPLRHPQRKWRVTFDLYPNIFYPLYCQGAGFAVSRDMAQCITADENIRDFRYNPFEDVSIGLLAEKCGYPHTSDCKKIRQYRTKDKGEIKQLNGQVIEEIKFLPPATMENRILQHRVKTHLDMYNHHKCVLEGC
jgi:hypothetical protein